MTEEDEREKEKADQLLAKVCESYGDEFSATMDRVSQLIGGKHRGEIGSQREVLVREFLREFLPSKYSISTGFIVAARDGAVSKQQDIVIWNSHDYMPLFRSGEFVIVPKGAVCALIEVKTTLNRNDVQEAMDQVLDPMFYTWGKAERNPFSGKERDQFRGEVPFRAIWGFKSMNAEGIFEAVAEKYRSIYDFDGQTRNAVMKEIRPGGYSVGNLVDAIVSVDGKLLHTIPILKSREVRERTGPGYLFTDRKSSVGEFLFLLCAALDGDRSGMARRVFRATAGAYPTPCVLQFSDRGKDPGLVSLGADDWIEDDECFWTPDQPLWAIG